MRRRHRPRTSPDSRNCRPLGDRRVARRNRAESGPQVRVSRLPGKARRGRFRWVKPSNLRDCYRDRCYRLARREILALRSCAWCVLGEHEHRSWNCSGMSITRRVFGLGRRAAFIAFNLGSGACAARNWPRTHRRDGCQGDLPAVPGGLRTHCRRVFQISGSDRYRSSEGSGDERCVRVMRA
jgi:hypothetical protein